MSVDQSYAAYLKAEALWVSAVMPDAARWTAQGGSREVISPFATRTGAEAEAARQAAFHGGPLVRDRAVVSGARRDLFGRAITLQGDRLGYEGAVKPAFVIGVEERPDGMTTLTVLRPLA